MKRHDYRQSWLARLTGEATLLPALGRVRTPLALAFAASLLLSALWLNETLRIATLDRQLVAIRIDAARAAASARSVRAIRELLEREGRIQQRIALAHRTALISSNAIASIGNALPVETWLTDVTTAPAGTWTISGRSARMIEIGSTLRAIQQLDTRGSARLVSITATGRSDRIHDFVIGWDRQP